MLRLARTWSALAIQTEAYEAIVCELVERAPAGDDREFTPSVNALRTTLTPQALSTARQPSGPNVTP